MRILFMLIKAAIPNLIRGILRWLSSASENSFISAVSTWATLLLHDVSVRSPRSPLGRRLRDVSVRSLLLFRAAILWNCWVRPSGYARR